MGKSTFLQDFKAFAMKGNVIDMAVGVIIGGAFGIVRGVFIVFVFFALVPVVMTVLPFDGFAELVEASKIGNALYHSNIIPTILEGHL